MLNDPYKGGTHLPDITLVSGVFSKKKLLFYVACRAHQSDIGGMSPGSMPLAEEIYQEGLRIPPVNLMSNGKINRGRMGHGSGQRAHPDPNVKAICRR